jgi:hypothetical protein
MDVKLLANIIILKQVIILTFYFCTFKAKETLAGLFYNIST